MCLHIIKHSYEIPFVCSMQTSPNCQAARWTALLEPSLVDIKGMDVETCSYLREYTHSFFTQLIDRLSNKQLTPPTRKWKIFIDNSIVSLDDRAGVCVLTAVWWLVACDTSCILVCHSALVNKNPTLRCVVVCTSWLFLLFSFSSPPSLIINPLFLAHHNRVRCVLSLLGYLFILLLRTLPLSPLLQILTMFSFPVEYQHVLHLVLCFCACVHRESNYFPLSSQLRRFLCSTTPCYPMC